MHAMNGPITPEKLAVQDRADALFAALRNNDRASAVIHLLEMLRAQQVAATGVRHFFRERGAEDLVPGMVAALAWSECPHCRRGFDRCHECDGSGHGEERSQACLPCGGVGVCACDFCGGSGAMTYDAIPRDLRSAVAAERAEYAIERVQKSATEPLPRTISPGQIGDVRRSLIKRMLENRRHLALLTNVVQFARQLRHDDPTTRKLTADLYRTSSRAATSARLLTARLYDLLARLSHVSSGRSSDTATVTFEEERATTFEMHARLMARWAKRRASLFPGH